MYFELLGRTGECDERLEKYLRSMHSTQIFRPSHDRVMQHSFTYAMIESEATKAAQTCLEKPDLVPAALIALDQMDNGGLQPATVLP
ncbi:MAG TPA: hypothetical protein VFA77_15090, partial [Candidatus Eisenbacteria bacterium]|nr:hypothetical protein [Candidatus Eisenbacteria bacterium]